VGMQQLPLFKGDQLTSLAGEAREAGRGVYQAAAASKRTEPIMPELMDQIVERENLIRAWKRVRANKGSPGIDGMTVEELTGCLREQWPRIREELLKGEYGPQPVKEVEIPKAGGGTRRLGFLRSWIDLSSRRFCRYSIPSTIRRSRSIVTAFGPDAEHIRQWRRQSGTLRKDTNGSLIWI